MQNVGGLTCCQDGPCWKSRCQLVGDGDEKDRRNLCEQPVQITPKLRIARCMHIITPADVVRRIEIYREGGALSLGVPPISRNALASGSILPSNRPAENSPQATNGRPSVHQPPLQSAPPAQTPPARIAARGNGAVATKESAPPRSIQTALPQPIRKAVHRLLLEFRHGLGDGVQLSILLLHLKHYHPEWIIELAALYGKHSVAQGLCDKVYILGEEPSRASYNQVVSLDWHECQQAHAQWPSTKPIRCLLDVFHLTPILKLCHYQIARSPAADARARDYLASICPSGPKTDGRFPAVLLHYQGNTSCDKKDLDHQLARQVCDTVRELGHFPVILDWDKRSPLIDQQRIFNPGADHPLWGGHGTGDAKALAALIEASALMIGVDSWPLHVAGATTTPTLGVWTRHHPVHYFDLAPNVRHLVPQNHPGLAIGAPAVAFFQQQYTHDIYTNLPEELVAQVRHQLTAEPVGRNPVAEFARIQEQEQTTRPETNHRGTDAAPLRSQETTNAQSAALTAVQYNRQYYEEHRRDGLDYLAYGDWQREYGRWFVESLGFQGRRVLDIGCACGSILRGLGEAGAIIAGVDLSDYMIRLGRQKWPDMAPRLHVADAADLHQFGDASWHAVHASQVAEHWLPEAVPKILRGLARITVPGGLFFCSLDTDDVFARQGRSINREDPTHVCIRPRTWWLEQLASTGWRDHTADYEPALKSHPQSFLRRYDWDWFVARKEGG